MPVVVVSQEEALERPFPNLRRVMAAIGGFFCDNGSYREQLTSLITGYFRFIGAPKSQASWERDV
jgi:hypothetical protein